MVLFCCLYDLGFPMGHFTRIIQIYFHWGHGMIDQLPMKESWSLEGVAFHSEKYHHGRNNERKNMIIE